MWSIGYAGAFKKDLKLIKKRGYDMQILKDALAELEANGQLPPSYRPHILSGNWSGYWEAHLSPDWLIIYKIAETIQIVRLVRTGTHSDLF